MEEEDKEAVVNLLRATSTLRTETFLDKLEECPEQEIFELSCLD